MAAEPQTTTVEVKCDTWDALNRRKDRGESFDDVIQRLIEATGLGVGEMEPSGAPTVETRNLRAIPEDHNPDKKCAHFDTVQMEECENEVVDMQEFRQHEDGDWGIWYWCEEHSPHEP